MSGVELIVGAVLGSVPIALEAFDRSGRLFETISTFKHYAKEVDLLEAKLGTQRVIFRNNAINLLTTMTQDRGSVEEILRRPSLPNAEGSRLAMSSVYKHRIDALGESFMFCRQTADQIDSVLRDLCLQFESIRCEVGTVSQKLSAPEWFKHVKSRVKLGLGKPQTEKAIKKLRALNGDFASISTQITTGLRQVSQDSQVDRSVSHRSLSSLNILQKYHRVRNASNALHSTLRERWVCSSHPCHSFALTIVDNGAADGKGKGKAPASRFVTCELATVPSSSSLRNDGGVRLEIEQDCESDGENEALRPEQVQGIAGLQQLTIALEANVGRFRPTSPTASRTGLGRLYRGFQGSDGRLPGSFEAGAQLANLSEGVTGSQTADPMSTAAVCAPAPDLSQVMDFCRELNTLMLDCMQRSLVATWQDPRAQWFCVPGAAIHTQTTSQSISDIVQWIAEKPVVRSFSRPTSVELATKIAEGIMQFYSTPWLVGSDLGRNVRYFNSAPSPSDAVDLKGPYFAAEVESARFARHADSGPAVSDTEGHADGMVQFADVRNKLLFSFGILLLEIGYGRPWSELRQSVTKPVPKSPGALSDYRAAERLAQHLVSQMGLSFPKIVKKCLGCDFGLGETDLDNEDLQRHFVKDVVAELERLGGRMREMDLALEA